MFKLNLDNLKEFNFGFEKRKGLKLGNETFVIDEVFPEKDGVYTIQRARPYRDHVDVEGNRIYNVTEVGLRLKIDGGAKVWRTREPNKVRSYRVGGRYVRKEKESI